MFSNSEVVPYIYNINGNLVIDKNSGYEIGNDKFLYGYYWSTPRIFNSINVCCIKRTLVDKDGLKLIGLYRDCNDGFNLCDLFIYKKNKIYHLWDIDIFDLYREHNKDFKKVQGILTDMFSIVDYDKDLLDCLASLLGMSILYNDWNNLIVIDTVITGYRDVHKCFIFNWKSKRNKLRMLLLPKWRKVNFIDSFIYITYDILTKHFYLLLINSNNKLKIIDLGVTKDSDSVYYSDFDNFTILSKEEDFEVYYNDKYLVSFKL